ncbi:hypothetical protein B0H12DRAFT_1109857 [Mycena haematopus]|nr:hypothetical protein B0H12DRAFT_1109857 [Mycena haematopus]
MRILPRRRSSLTLDSPSPTSRRISCARGSPAKRLKKFKTEDVRDDALKDVADIYLTHTPALPIDPAPNADFYVSRKFLLNEFGVLNQTFLGYFKSTDADDGRRRGAIFPQPFLNPFLPRAPGEPGLIFASRFEIVGDHDGMPWALFCKPSVKGKPKVVWRYMGDYRNRHCGDLTAEQFKRQEVEVQQQWGKLILKSKKVPTYVAMRARIALRKANIDFVRGDATEALEIAEITRRGGKGKPHPVSADDIVRAFGRGEERIGIIKLECVSYNHGLVEDMERREAGLPRAQTKAGVSKGKESRRAVETSKGKSKRKRPPRSKAPAEEESLGSDYAPQSEDESGWSG